MALQSKVATYSSIGQRVLCYIFFRWVAGPVSWLYASCLPNRTLTFCDKPALPLTIFTLFALYVPSFIATYLSFPEYQVVEDEIDVTVKETIVREEGDDEDEAGPAFVEAEVDEMVVLAEKTPNPWWSLLTGAPIHHNPHLSVLTFAINVILAAMVADILFRNRFYNPSNDLSFVRLGYVSPSEANFVIREPDQAKMPVTLEIHIKDAQPPFDNTLWQTGGGVRWTDNSSDYTATLTVPLRHNRQRVYEWRTSNNHSGEFVAPPKAGHMSEYDDGKFTFLSTSCILPRFPYSPLDHPLAIPGLRHLAKWLPELKAQLMLFLGDFIYIDVPKRMGQDAEAYRQKYRHVYASPDWAPVGQNLSWIHVLDDHEIANDWSANTTGVYDAAVDPWHHYQAAVNPPKATAAGTTAQRTGATYFEFTQGPASFFLLDTRSYRSDNDEPFESPDKTMLGAQQLEDFIAWLRRPEPAGVRWKIIASSVPLTKNWPINTKDTWGGFLFERRRVLEAMWDAGARGVGVVVVSGDRHEFAATKFPPPTGGRWPETATAFEFSCSPLNQYIQAV